MAAARTVTLELTLELPQTSILMGPVIGASHLEHDRILTVKGSGRWLEVTVDSAMGAVRCDITPLAELAAEWLLEGSEAGDVA